MIRLFSQYFTCPLWNRPLIDVTPDGIEVRCKSCKGTKHHISREHLEQAWNDLSKLNTKPLQAVRA